MERLELKLKKETIGFLLGGADQDLVTPATIDVDGNYVEGVYQENMTSTMQSAQQRLPGIQFDEIVVIDKNTNSNGNGNGK